MKKPSLLIILLIGALVLLSGCITNTNENPDTVQKTLDAGKVTSTVPISEGLPKNDTPIVTNGTLAGGIKFVGRPEVGGYDIDGDGKVDIHEDTYNSVRMMFDGASNMAEELHKMLDIQLNSKLHTEFPNMQKFVLRTWDLDKNGRFDDPADKIEIIINDEVVASVTENLNGDRMLDIKDVLQARGW